MKTGFDSYHDNHREDRKWRFYHASTKLRCKLTEWSWTTQKNSWDCKLSFSCPDRSVLNGVLSVHDNHTEDRRWQFRCCTLPDTVIVKRRGYTKYINGFDGRIAWFCPRSNEAVVALTSYHDNHFEDRRWKFECGAILKAL